MWGTMDTTETDMSDSFDEDDDEGGEQAAAEAVSGAVDAEAAAAAEANAVDAFDVDQELADSSYDDSTESVYGWEDENGEQLEDEGIEQNEENGEDDGQQERRPSGWMSDCRGGECVVWNCAATVSGCEVNRTRLARTREYDALTEGGRHEMVGMTEEEGMGPSSRAST